MRIPGIDYGAGRVQPLGRESPGSQMALGNAEARAELARGGALSTVTEAARGILGVVHDRQVAVDVAEFQTFWTKKDMEGRAFIEANGQLTAEDAARVGIELPKAADGSDRLSVPMFEVERRYYNAWMEQAGKEAEGRITLPQALQQAKEWSAKSLLSSQGAIVKDQISRQRSHAAGRLKVAHDAAVKVGDGPRAEKLIHDAANVNAITRKTEQVMLAALPIQMELGGYDRVLLEQNVAEMNIAARSLRSEDYVGALTPGQRNQVAARMEASATRIVAQWAKSATDLRVQDITNLRVRILTGEGEPVTREELELYRETNFWGDTPEANDRGYFRELGVWLTKEADRGKLQAAYARNEQMSAEGGYAGSKVDRDTAERVWNDRYDGTGWESQMQATTKGVLGVGIFSKSGVRSMVLSTQNIGANPRWFQAAVSLARELRDSGNEQALGQLDDKTIDLLMQGARLRDGGMPLDRIDEAITATDWNRTEVREYVDRKWREDTRNMNFRDEAADFYGTWYDAEVSARFAIQYQNAVRTAYNGNGQNLDDAVEHVQARIRGDMGLTKFNGPATGVVTSNSVESSYPSLTQASAGTRDFVEEQRQDLLRKSKALGGDPATTFVKVVPDKSKWPRDEEGTPRPVYNIGYLDEDTGYPYIIPGVVWAPDTTAADAWVEANARKAADMKRWKMEKAEEQMERAGKQNIRQGVEDRRRRAIEMSVAP